MTEALLRVSGLTVRFGGLVAVDDASLEVRPGEIKGLIGPNGVGKTTLFKTIVGLEPIDSGDLKVGETVKISYVDQSRAGLDPRKNVWETVSEGLDFIKVGNVEMPSRAYVSAFGFKGPDQQKPAGVLSGGERNRLNLALTLKQGGNLLLLDEPTNDLDIPALEVLEESLLEFPGAVVLVSHDRAFLDNVAQWILELDRGRAYPYEGNYSTYLEKKQERLQVQGKKDVKLAKRLKDELEWVRQNAKGRQTKSKARLDRYEENKVARLGVEAARPHRVTHRKLTRD